MIDLRDLRLEVIRPSLTHLRLWSPAAEALVLATALAESGASALRQRGGGPALGLWQVEPRTHRDLWDNYLAHRPPLKNALLALRHPSRSREALTANLFYGAAVCRLIYRRAPAPLPEAGDLEAMARYWKTIYNTWRGRGTVEHFVAAVEPHWLTSAFRDNPRPGT